MDGFASHSLRMASFQSEIHTSIYTKTASITPLPPAPLTTNYPLLPPAVVFVRSASSVSGSPPQSVSQCQWKKRPSPLLTR